MSEKLSAHSTRTVINFERKRREQELQKKADLRRKSLETREQLEAQNQTAQMWSMMLNKLNQKKED